MSTKSPCHMVHIRSIKGRQALPTLGSEYPLTAATRRSQISISHSGTRERILYNSTQGSDGIFLGLLLGLQCITLMWFVMICRVIAKVIRGEGADDSRSDDEDGEEEDSVPDSPSYSPQTKAMPAFIEVEADPSELSYGSSVRRVGSGSRRPKAKSGGGFATGLNLGDKKDILNRIGCLSEEQLAREREKMGSRPGSARESR